MQSVTNLECPNGYKIVEKFVNKSVTNLECPNGYKIVEKFVNASCKSQMHIVESHLKWETKCPIRPIVEKFGFPNNRGI